MDSADRVLRNGTIYTVDDAQPWAEAVAIADGRFVAVGTNEEVDEFIGDGTEVADLEGRMAMPGIFDIHIHPVDGSMAALYDCSFPFTSTVEQILEHVAGCVAEAESGEWIRGGQWGVGLATLEQSISAELLNTVAPDNPVFLVDSTVHNAWVNTLALERLEIRPDTPDPPGGSIVRDSSGIPNGILIDDAAYNAISTLPDYSPEQYEEALAWTVEMLNQYGVTGFKDAIAEEGSLRAYNALDRSGRLNARIAASLIWKRSWIQGHEEHVLNIEQRDTFRSERVNPDFIKIFLDGIAPSQTAYMLEPYQPHDAFPPDHRGEPLHDSATLAEDVTNFDALGLTVKMHAIGDGALRQGLNAIEAARAANGQSGLRHEISHAGLMHADDIGRFSELGAVPELAPILWYPVPGLVEAQTAAIGRERAEQAIGLETALEIMTINGAKALKAEDVADSIEVGKSADLIVLDRNVFEIPVRSIADTLILTTIFEGRTVHDVSPQAGDQ